MTLRTRLFLIVGGLVSLLVGAEWALVTALTNDLEQEAGSFALEVGGGVLGSLLMDFEALPFDSGVTAAQPEPDPAAEPEDATPRIQWTSHASVNRYVFSLHDVSRPEAGRVGDVRQRVHELEGTIVSGSAPDRGRWIGAEDKVLRIVMRQGGPQPDGEDVAERRELARAERATRHVTGRLLPTVAEAARWRVEPMFLIELADAEPFGAGLELPQGLVGHPPLAVARARGAPADGSRDPRNGSEAEATTEWVEATRGAPVASGPAGSADDPTIERSIPLPQAGFQKAVDGFLGRLWLGTLAIFGLGLAVAGWLAHRVSVPLRRLSRAATEVGEGALGTQVATDGDRELAATLAAFNRMSTRLKDLDEEARALREREHLTEIGEVARGLAHAMRNPLHLLGLSVEQLATRCDASDSAAGELALSARGQIQRVDRSLRSFLSLSSGAGGACEEVRVDDLVRDVALELLQDGAHAPVRIEAVGEHPAVLRGVAAELRAVVHVLVVNAVEASASESEVLVRVLAHGDGVTVEVLDEGAGLAPAVRERLFTPHLSTKVQGAGMGLFLAQRIATSRYGGELRLDPREPRGTRAVLRLFDRKGDIHG